jgi:hypothetical protein
MANRYKYVTISKLSSGKRIYNTTLYPKIPLSNDDLYILCNSTDRYDKLAQVYYNDPQLWWIISTANDASSNDSLFPPTGSYVRIPQNYLGPLREYIRLNDTSPTMVDNDNDNSTSPSAGSGY